MFFFDCQHIICALSSKCMKKFCSLANSLGCTSGLRMELEKGKYIHREWGHFTVEYRGRKNSFVVIESFYEWKWECEKFIRRDDLIFTNENENVGNPFVVAKNLLRMKKQKFGINS